MADFTFHHGGASVPSLEDAIDWYGRVLGFEVEKRFRIESAKANAVVIRKGPLRFELFEVEGERPSPKIAARRSPISRRMATSMSRFRWRTLTPFSPRWSARAWTSLLLCARRLEAAASYATVREI